MSIDQSKSHYLLEKNISLLKELNESIHKDIMGLFILIRIKNIINIDESKAVKNTKNITPYICDDLKKVFPEYIFSPINEKYFFIIVNNIAKEEYESTAEDIQKTIECKKYLDNSLSINVTTGISLFPDDSSVAEEIFKKAYFALKSISSSNDQHYIFFHQFFENQTVFLKNKSIAKKMKQAFKSSNTFLSFQPIIDSQEQKILFYECTLKTEENVSDEFTSDNYISTAEKFGFINIINDLTLNLVINELINHPDIKLSINISLSCIYNQDWIKKAVKLLQNKNIHNRLIIEIDESIIHKEFKKSINFIRNLKSLGCKVLIDNFGSGYTSFAQLKKLPVDLIKIEGLYIQDILNNYNSEFFVKSVIEMKALLNKKIIADFVENKDVMNKLIELGIDALQGNQVSKQIINPAWRSK